MRALRAVDFAEMTMVSSFYVGKCKISGSCIRWPVSKPRRRGLPVLKWYNKSEAAAAAARYKNKNANADFGRGASNIIFYSLHFDNRYPNC